MMISQPNSPYAALRQGGEASDVGPIVPQAYRRRKGDRSKGNLSPPAPRLHVSPQCLPTNILHRQSKAWDPIPSQANQSPHTFYSDLIPSQILSPDAPLITCQNGPLIHGMYLLQCVKNIQKSTGNFPSRKLCAEQRVCIFLLVLRTAPYFLLL